MRRLIVIIYLLFVAWGPVRAQQATSDFYDGPREVSAYEPVIVSDPELFYIPVEGSYDIFSRLSNYNFQAVRYMRRGYSYRFSKYYVNGIDLSEAVSGRIHFSVLSALNYVPGSRAYTSGNAMSSGMVGGLSGIDEISILPSASRPGGVISLLASDKSARIGFRASISGNMGDKWFYSAYMGRRWGRDANVDGLFMDEAAAALALERKLGRGSLTLFAVAAPSERSVRTAATKEAFELTGDNLYNPSWGWFQGKERASRVRRNFTPMGMLVYQGAIDAKNTLKVSAAYTGGENSYSGLSWYDATSPLPDYYRYLPSYIAQPDVSGRMAELWRSRNPKVTQIDWQEMAWQNAMADGEAVYAVHENVERINSVQFAASIANRAQRRLAIDYGIRARLDRTDNFNRLRDLLGAGWVTDVDQYLIDDEYYGDKAQNDMRYPDRRVREDEKFGYNYRITRNMAGAFATVSYGDRRLRLSAGGEGGQVFLHREGLYEKELFPGNASYGPSERADFFEYTLKLAAGYSFGPRHFLDAVATFADFAPAAENILLSPRYSNVMIAGAPTTFAASGEVSYRLVLPHFGLKISGFYTRTDKGTDIMHYYDDISSTYSNLVMSGISKTYYGAELGCEAILSPRLSLLAAISLASYTYASDPRMDLFADADGSNIYSGENSHLENYRLGGTPQSVASAELRYSGTHGWLASITVNYMADSYISPNPTRRMYRSAGYSTSPESQAEILSQERFPSATTLGLFVLKSFKVGSSNFSATFSVNNLLDRRDIVYSGYEQMRLAKTGSGINRTYTPFASKYTYSYGRTWYASLTYKF